MVSQRIVDINGGTVIYKNVAHVQLNCGSVFFHIGINSCKFGVIGKLNVLKLFFGALSQRILEGKHQTRHFSENVASRNVRIVGGVVSGFREAAGSLERCQLVGEKRSVEHVHYRVIFGGAKLFKNFLYGHCGVLFFFYKYVAR